MVLWTILGYEPQLFAAACNISDTEANINLHTDFDKGPGDLYFLRTAASLLRHARTPTRRKEIYIVSDFDEVLWSNFFTNRSFSLRHAISLIRRQISIYTQILIRSCALTSTAVLTVFISPAMGLNFFVCPDLGRCPRENASILEYFL